MKKVTFILFLSIFQFCGLSSFAQNKTNIPLHPRVKHGTLSNGMTYYIMHNEEPKDRVSFYFVQNVGAILEEDTQNGLAHFLEHMAFNGTKHFEGKGIITYLEKNGVRFGADINAYTSRDETVYNLSNIPSGNNSLIDSALLVLHDWSGCLLLKEEEIDAERGVIREEWRTRRNVRKRLSDQSAPVLYNHSKYAKRDVIGSLDVINNFKYQELRDYYHKWYRPDLQSVVVVGDIDSGQMEEKIKKLFSNIPLKKNPAERIYYQIPDSKELGYVVAKDREAQGMSIEWVFRKDTEKIKDERVLRKNIVESMYNTMFNNRLSELLRKSECAAVGMQVGNFNMARTKAANYLFVSPKEKREIEAFTQLVTELERVKRHGFTKTELERAKIQILRSYESSYEEREKISNETWAKKLGDYFLKADPVPSMEWEFEFAQKMIPDITIDEVNAISKEYSNIKNSVLCLSGVDKEGLYYPTKDELLNVINNVGTEEISAYKDDIGSADLISGSLEDKEIVSESVIKGTEAKLYKLENGAKVVILPTEYSKDEILLNAFSFGGSSVISTEDLKSAAVADKLAQISGIGELNAVQLQKKLTGKLVNISPGLNKFTEEFSGFAAPKDFETLLQLLYLSFEKPRFDKDALNAQLEKWKNKLINSSSDNGKALSDTIEQMLSNHHPRTFIFNEEFVNSVQFEKAERIYQDRFQDANDFTFLFVGNIDVDKHLPLIRKYIGNISSSNRKENWVQHNIRPAKGSSENMFERKMEVPKTTVYYSIVKDLEFNFENRIYLSVIADLLSKRYMETIREAEGGSYGVGVSPALNKRPYEHSQISIYFDCNPEKEERLIEIVLEEIEKLKKQGPIIEDLEKIKENYLKNRTEAEEKNSFWLGNLKAFLLNEERIVNKKEYHKFIESIDVKSIKKFVGKLFKNTDSVKVVMNPNSSNKPK